MANIATAKNQLSRLLRRVKRGETVVITERNRPIARIQPLAPADLAKTDVAQLVAAGVLSPPAGGPLDVKAFLEAPRGRLSAGLSLTGAVLSEREEGR